MTPSPTAVSFTRHALVPIIALAALLPACTRKETPAAPPKPAAAAVSASVPPPAVAHLAPNADPNLEVMQAQHGAVAGPEVLEEIKLPRAQGANGKTVQEIYTQRAALNGKPVAVRAKVVKITRGVLGKNWIHLRDGTGSRAGKDDDLTVTTTEDVAATGDVILVRGTVGVDKDFGSGYTYPVMVENAKIGK